MAPASVHSNTTVVFLYRPFWIKFIEVFPQQPINELTLFTFVVSYGILFVAGFPGNVAAFVVMTCSSKIRHHSYANYLAALAVYDLVSLTGPLLAWVNLIRFNIAGKSIVRFSTVACKFVNFYMYVANAGSFTSIGIVSVERFVAVCFPFAAGRICTARSSKLIVAGQFGVIIIVTIENLFTTSFEPGYGCFYTENANRTHTILAVGIFTIGTSVLVFTLNSITILTLIRSTKMTGRGTNDNTDSKVKQITVMLLTVSCTFVVLLFPTDLLVLVASFAPEAAAKYLLIYDDLFKFLYITNNVINFYLYIVSGREIRKALSAVLKCRSYK
ncbi:melatonin receptor type 1B-B-like [Tubulanus polymorphus]|uniref:melatonin receptor type 1B-B-like n=1 Tax=Tubulanus polymorphus TaxID=672921 RepID=UPI003DA5D741